MARAPDYPGKAVSDIKNFERLICIIGDSTKEGSSNEFVKKMVVRKLKREVM